MTREQIIIELYNSHFVENYARKYCGKIDMLFFDDIVQELYTMICELPDEKLTVLCQQKGYNAVRRYVSGLIIRQMRSQNSIIYKLYTGHYYNEQPSPNIGTWEEEKSEI